MTNLLSEALKKAENLPEYLQDELAQQLIEDIENEIAWHQELSQPQHPKLDDLAEKALQHSINGRTQKIGFDEL